MPTADSEPGRVVVLGATGFIGRVLCRRYAEAGHDIAGVARRTPADPPVGQLVELDLSTASSAEVAAMLAEVRADVVVNAAGGMWGLTDEQMYDANVTLVTRLVDALAELPRRPRLVHLGTVHEYGLTPIGEVMTEETPARPVMPYGDLKLRCTEIVLAAAEAGRIDGGVLRVGNVVGAGQPGHSLLGVLAAKLGAAAAAGQRAVLELAPLTARRDFVDLDDTVDAVLAATRSPKTGWLVNIGRGEGVSARAMVDLLIAASGVPTDVVDAPATGPAEADWQCMDVSRAAGLFGWKPRRGLAESMTGVWAGRPTS